MEFYTIDGKRYGIKDDVFFYEDIEIPLEKIKKIFFYKSYIANEFDIYPQNITVRIVDFDSDYPDEIVDKVIEDENKFEEIIKNFIEDVKICVDL